MHLIIPMSGEGARFKAAGCHVIKPLIEVDGKPVIGCILDAFPGVEKVTFICNRVHLETTPLRGVLEKLCPSGTVVPVEPHKLGPVHAVRQAYDRIDDREQVVVNYCDFAWEWDFADFRAFVKSRGVDGCIPSYIGFHPHNLGPGLYAFMRTAGDRVLEIREKHHFTPNKMDEHASSGTYYFRTGALLKKYFDLAVERDLSVNGEHYISSVFQPVIEDGLDVAVYPLRRFCQWGTPEDLENYLMWSDIFRRKALGRHRGKLPAVTVLILMAGAGNRFARAGYSRPKPFIAVSGRPMAAQACRCLPEGAGFVIAAQRSHVSAYSEELAEILTECPGASVFALDGVTEGQAVTASMASAGLDPSSPLLVCGCDAGLVFDPSALAERISGGGADVLMFSFRNYLPAAWRPETYGWIRTDGTRVLGVSTKKPVSGIPIKDHAVAAAFFFRRTDILTNGVRDMTAANRRINNEFYLDELVNILVEQGRRVEVFEIERYVSWGTPEELRTFQYWQEHFHLKANHPYRMEDDPDFPAGG